MSYCLELRTRWNIRVERCGRARRLTLWLQRRTRERGRGQNLHIRFKDTNLTQSSFPRSYILKVSPPPQSITDWWPSPQFIIFVGTLVYKLQKQPSWLRSKKPELQSSCFEQLPMLPSRWEWEYLTMGGLQGGSSRQQSRGRLSRRWKSDRQ